MTSNELLDIFRRAKDEEKIDFVEIVSKVQKSIEDPDFLKQMQEISTIERFLLSNQEIPIVKDKGTDIEGDYVAPLRISNAERANSNAYSETVVRDALRVLYPADYARLNFEYKIGKNADLEVL